MDDDDSARRRPASFSTQAGALLRKNLCFQERKPPRRNLKSNVGITVFPVLICVLLVVLQNVINGELDKPKRQCGCECVESDMDGACLREECGIQYSTLEQVWTCVVPSPPRWPALIQVPWPGFRAVASQLFNDLPDPLCRDDGSCPVTVLITGEDQTLAESYDFLNTMEYDLNVNVWYNSTYNDNTAYSFIAALRVPRLVNAVSNAYLKVIRGSGLDMLLEYVKETPKVGTRFRLDLSSLLSVLFFTWIVELLFPVMLTYLVYEEEQKLKIMMKMHGLKDGPYWLISYAYFFALSVIYMTFFVIFGSLIGLNFFRVNDYSIQFVFFFIYINLQIALAFFVASFFSSVKTATVIGYIYVFGSGLLGAFLFCFFVEDRTFPNGWVLVMEIVPGFSLYRGLYELGQYAFSGSAMGASGMTWGNLKDPINGMGDIFIIMTVEWASLLMLAFYLDQVSPVGGGVRKRPLFFFRCSQKKHTPSLQKPSFVQRDSKVIIDMEKPDVAQEREVVEQLLMDPNANQALVEFLHFDIQSTCDFCPVICHNLKKIYPGRDGNPDKLAVQGLSLALPKGQCFGMLGALPKGQCFGMLGPNGAGKTSFISMMTGLVKPTSGTSYVHGMDMDMDHIYTNMGVCPQHDLLWEPLTGKEHLFLYGRLKNLKGAPLVKAVDDALKSVNLFHGGVGDKQ
ncbi:hypothetical protein E2562_020407, partial [Oryza meyeriana var. granulata]